MLTHVILGRIAATQPVYELPSTQERNTNNIRTHPNPGYTNNISVCVRVRACVCVIRRFLWWANN